MANKTKSGTSVQKQKTSLHANPNNGFKASFLKKFYGFVADRLPRSFSEFVVLATVFLLPLFFWPFTYTSFELPKVSLFRTLSFVLLAGIIVAWVISRIKVMPNESTKNSLKKLPEELQNVPSPSPNFSRIKLPLILLALMVISWVISTALSPAPAVGVFGYYPRFQGLYTLLCYIIFAALAFWGTANAAGRTGIDRVLSVIVASSFLVSLSAFLQSWGVLWLNYWDVSTFLGRFFGTMGHPDYLASFLVIVIPIQIERIFANKGRLLAIPALSFSLAALYFTLSRSAFLGLFFALMFFLMIASKKLGLKKLFITSLLMPFLLLAALFTVNVFRDSDFVSNNTLLSRMVLEDENLRSVQTRLVLWPATISQILDSPIYGYGPDSYAISFPKYAPAELNTLENLGDYPDRAHNFILDYAVQFGIPGLLVFLALIATVFFRTLRFVFRQKTGWLTPLALMSALLGLLVANLFGFFVTVTWVYFWLILAVLLRLTTPVAKEMKINRAKKLGILATATVVTIIAGGAVVATQDVFLFAADMAYRDGDVGVAARFAPQISFYSYRESVALTNAVETTAALERMGRITGYDGLYYLQKGKLLAESAPSGDTAFTSAFDSAIAKMPTYAPAYLEYGKALYARAAYSKAAEVLEEYLNLCPQYYLWKGGLGARTPEEQLRYRIFYKQNPDFNDVIPMIANAYAKSAQTPANAAEAEYYKNLTFY